VVDPSTAGTATGAGGSGSTTDRSAAAAAPSAVTAGRSVGATDRSTGAGAGDDRDVDIPEVGRVGGAGGRPSGRAPRGSFDVGTSSDTVGVAPVTSIGDAWPTVASGASPRGVSGGERNGERATAGAVSGSRWTTGTPDGDRGDDDGCDEVGPASRCAVGVAPGDTDWRVDSHLAGRAGAVGASSSAVDRYENGAESAPSIGTPAGWSPAPIVAIPAASPAGSSAPRR
jgi:hypothetical protein